MSDTFRPSLSIGRSAKKILTGSRARRFLGNGLLVLVSFLVCLLVAEAATRVIDDLPAIGVVLPERVAARGVDTTSSHFDRLPRARGAPREL